MVSDGGEGVVCDEVQAWLPARATDCIRKLARSGSLKLHWTKAVKLKLTEIDLTMGDVMHVLKHGFVHKPGVRSTRPPLFKYCIETPTPNSNNRTVRAVVIPSEDKCVIKVVDVQWVDEPMIKS
jgi:hypothetical protein